MKDMKYICRTLFTLLLVCLMLPVQAQKKKTNQVRKKQQESVAQAKESLFMTQWVDSMMAQLTLEEKIGQLMMVRVPRNMNAKQQKEFSQLITEQKVGGICFFAGTCADQLEQTKRYQKMAPIPLLVSIDGEWGLGMRLTDAYAFPRQMMMGAIPSSSDSLIYLMGLEIGRQCNKMGIHINFAPVVDLNSNPNNPVIGTRSFGENRESVAAKGIRYTKGLQDRNVVACAKHFPGHGDTEVDSHVGLPTIDHTKAYMDSVDLYPFRRLINSGVRGVMVGHLQVPAYEKSENLPATLSERITNELLRKEMHFNGLIFTDGMDMGAVKKSVKNKNANLMALQAGADVLLLPVNIESSIKTIAEYAGKNKNFAKLIDLKCRNVLREKYRCGLQHLNLDSLSVPTQEDYRRCEELTERMASKAATLVKNERKMLPILRSESFFNIHIGQSDSAISTISGDLAAKISSVDKVIISLHTKLNAGNDGNYGVTSEQHNLIRTIIAHNSNTILVIYGPAYVLKQFPLKKEGQKSDGYISAQEPLDSPAAIVMAYQNRPEIENATMALLRNGERLVGRLPVSIGSYKQGLFVKIEREKIYNPYELVTKAGMDANCFKKIDTIAMMGIKKKAYPGCQVLVAKGGKIVYHRGYGRQTYDDNSPLVDTNTIYDLASVTKVAATTFAVMKLVDSKKIALDDELSTYLPYLKHSNKKNITIRQALSHIARLKAFDNFYTKVDPRCANLSLEDSPIDIDCDECREKIMKEVAKSDLTKEKNKYLYSDLGFMLLADMVRVVSGQTIDIFMDQQFYQPMHLTTTTYRPRLKDIDTNLIAPTENDTYFRHRLLRGEVHDQNASAMGGVSGHAGLFSNARDLAQLYIMMLGNGTYKGRQYLTPEVLKTFNQRYYTQYGNRRSLGYDKPLINGPSGHCAPQASQQSFGHTGFTGTMVWVDPKYDLIYIFLSNRVYPTASSNKLASLNIRTDIQEQIYKSIGK